MSEFRSNRDGTYTITLDVGSDAPTFSAQCNRCKRLRSTADRTCDAFPDGIPDAIWRAECDHRKAYPGDNGVTFEPVDDDAAEYVAALFEDTDA